MPKSLFSDLDFENGLACMEAGDYENASGFFRKAAECGHAGAQYYLGMMYINGLGLPRSREDALMWLNKAAEQDHAGARQELCVLRDGTEILDGEPPPEDPLDGLYREGLRAEDLGYNRRAIALWKKVLEQNIRHLDALDALACAYTRAGKPKQAKIYSSMAWKVAALQL